MKRVIVVTLLVMLFVMALSTPVFAQELESGPSEVVSFAIAYVVAIGLAPLILAVTQFAKVLGVIPDGSAGTVVAVLSLVAVVIVGIASSIWGFDVESESAQTVIKILVMAGQLLLTFLTSVVGFKGLRAANVKGFRPDSAPRRNV